MWLLEKNFVVNLGNWDYRPGLGDPLSTLSGVRDVPFHPFPQCGLLFTNVFVPNFRFRFDELGHEIFAFCRIQVDDLNAARDEEVLATYVRRGSRKGGSCRLIGLTDESSVFAQHYAPDAEEDYC